MVRSITILGLSLAMLTGAVAAAQTELQPFMRLTRVQAKNIYGMDLLSHCQITEMADSYWATNEIYRGAYITVLETRSNDGRQTLARKILFQAPKVVAPVVNPQRKEVAGEFAAMIWYRGGERDIYNRWVSLGGSNVAGPFTSIFWSYPGSRTIDYGYSFEGAGGENNRLEIYYTRNKGDGYPPGTYTIARLRCQTEEEAKDKYSLH